MALIIANWTILILPLAFAIFVILRMPKEEQMMIDKFGERFKSYMNKTGMIIPKINFKNRRTE